MGFIVTEQIVRLCKMPDNYCDKISFHTSRLHHQVKHIRVEAGILMHVHIAYAGTLTHQLAHTGRNAHTHARGHHIWRRPTVKSMRAHMHGHAHGRQ